MIYRWTFFAIQSLICQTAGRSVAHQKCISRWFLDLAPKIDSEHSSAALPMLQGGDEVWNFTMIFDPSRIWGALVSKRSNVSEM